MEREMADLQNMYKHMRGGSVRVNGNVYAIDKRGIAQKVKAKDAEKMLLGNAWTIADPKRVVEPEPESPLLDDNGEPVTDEDDDAGEPATNEEPDLDIDQLKSMADELGVSYGPNIGKALLMERIEEATNKDPG
jgi:hypothetical protein